MIVIPLLDPPWFKQRQNALRHAARSLWREGGVTSLSIGLLGFVLQLLELLLPAIDPQEEDGSEQGQYQRKQGIHNVRSSS